MAERKAQNKWIPPDFDPEKHGSINGYHKSHPLRERMRKIGEGTTIIRFEMPYNIWCNGCGNHIGMGVRYNSEKKKIGMYYTTTIFRFRFKCHLCPNRIEMKNDPQNLDYIIISGARRQERRWDAKENEQIVAEDKKDHYKLELDSMYALERGIVDQSKKLALIPTMDHLKDIQDEFWSDDFTQNQRLRNILRTEKKIEKAKENEEISLKSKYALNIPLLERSQKDDYMAKLILDQRNLYKKSCRSKSLVLKNNETLKNNHAKEMNKTLTNLSHAKQIRLSKSSKSLLLKLGGK